MRIIVSFEVLGVPAPQGSKTAFVRGGRAVLAEGGSSTGRAKHKAWRAAVSEAARDVADPEPHDGALQLSITFRLPMPSSRPKRQRVVGIWPHSVRPDIDKLLRSTLDGLGDGGLIVDDARIFAIEAEAYEVTGWTGAEISLRSWTQDD